MQKVATKVLGMKLEFRFFEKSKVSNLRKMLTCRQVCSGRTFRVCAYSVPRSFSQTWPMLRKGWFESVVSWTFFTIKKGTKLEPDTAFVGTKRGSQFSLFPFGVTFFLPLGFSPEKGNERMDAEEIVAPELDLILIIALKGVAFIYCIYLFIYSVIFFGNVRYISIFVYGIYIILYVYLNLAIYKYIFKAPMHLQHFPFVTNCFSCPRSSGEKWGRSFVREAVHL